MESLPTELHELIVQHCLCDDGSTIRALSAVCRYLNCLASPHLYHTIYLTQENKKHRGRIRKLSKRLFASLRNDRTPRTVRHLFINLSHLGDTAAAGTSDWLAALQILVYSRQTLTTLTLKYSNRIPCRVKFTTFLISFCKVIYCPVLEELVISGSFYLPRIDMPRDNFPSLTHLHIMDSTSTLLILMFPSGNLDDVFPHLTHLRVSGIHTADFVPQAFQNSFHRSQGIEVGPVDSLFGYLPPLIRRAVLQFKAESENTVLGSSRTLLNTLTTRSAECENPPMSLELAEDGDISFSQLKRAWLDRISGGEGWWGTRDFSDAITYQDEPSWVTEHHSSARALMFRRKSRTRRVLKIVSLGCI